MIFEIFKWAGLGFLVLLIIGVVLSKGSKPGDKMNPIFWIGFAGALISVVTCSILTLFTK